MRTYYHNDIDFEQLAKDDATFHELYSRNKRIDWQNPDVIQQITKAILRRDFNLNLTLPDDRLCPPVPVRWNYVRWIQELLDTTDPSFTDRYDPARAIIGLDIGIGASCIYGLLACATRPHWRLLGTDIDEKSISYAQQNVDDNNFSSRIRLKHTAPEDALIPLDNAGIDRIDFTICNPPFYSSTDDMQAAYGGKAMPPSAVCTGSINEMICEGGDLGFARRILAESLELRERVRWYSCMLCRLASAKALVEKIKEAGINNFAATNLKAGQKTVRWAVAWSFETYRPRNDVVRHGDLVLALLAPATERTINVPGVSTDMLSSRIDSLMRELDLQWRYDSVTGSGLVVAKANVWSRSARRRRKAAEPAGRASTAAEESMDVDDTQTTELAVKICCRDNIVDLRWLQGEDTVLFESFSGMLRLALGQRKGIQ